LNWRDGLLFSLRLPRAGGCSPADLTRTLNTTHQANRLQVANMHTFSSRCSWHASFSAGAAVRCHARRLAKTTTSKLEPDTAVEEKPASAPTTKKSRRKKATSAKSSPSADEELAYTPSSATFEVNSNSAEQAYPNAATSQPDAWNEEAQHVASFVTASSSPGSQVQEDSVAQDVSLQQAFEEVQHEARTSPFTEEVYAPAYQNVATMTGTVASAPELQQLRSGTEITKFMLRVRRPGTTIVDTCAPSTTCQHYYDMYGSDAPCKLCRECSRLDVTVPRYS
jgi:hypothetical protein